MAEHPVVEQRAAEHCVDAETLSARLDGELDEAARQQVDAHLAGCPACAAQLAALRELSVGFAPMRADTLGFDLAGVIDGRLAEAAAGNGRRQPVAKARRRGWLDWLPLTAGAAASLVLGIGMGSALVAESPANDAAPTLLGAMRVFDPMPPGSVCIGLDSCYDKGASK